MAYDNQNRIFTTAKYQKFKLEKDNTNEFENYIKEPIENAIGIAKNEGGMQNLASGIANLFDKEKDEVAQLKAINLWNSNVKATYKTNSNAEISEQYQKILAYKDEVCIYYEYMQFKRARFDCIEEEVKYNPNTGRIIEMSFKFTGKFN